MIKEAAGINKGGAYIGYEWVGAINMKQVIYNKRKTFHEIHYFCSDGSNSWRRQLPPWDTACTLHSQGMGLEARGFWIFVAQVRILGQRRAIKKLKICIVY